MDANKEALRKMVTDLDARLKGPHDESSAPDMMKAYELGYVNGMDMARKLIRLKLGLAAPSDLEN